MSRRYYIDYLKAFGCLAIVMLHVITNRLDHVAITEMNYYILSGLLVFTRWAVPAFLMISGCNLLGREEEFKLVKKHVLKIFVFVIIWGIIHWLADPIINFIIGKPVPESMLSVSSLFQGSAYHLWFCFTIIGLYLLIPVLNRIVMTKVHCEYFILVCLFSSVFLPFLNSLGDSFQVLHTVEDYLQFPEFGIYVCYFVLGYYIDRYLELNLLKRRVIYVLSFISMVIMILYGYINAFNYHVHKSITAPKDLTVVVFSIGIFIFFKNNLKKGKLYPAVSLLAKYSLGIYAMHNYLVIRLSWNGIHSLMFNPFIAVPIVTVIVAVVCLLMCCILKKIPYIGKWII